MYKVMVIDDEAMIRWGIRDLLDWEREGFSFCEDGRDGRDGLKKLLAHRPELVLVDIKMPGLSGIDLIRAARDNGFEGSFIILTGYAEFEFAKSAMKLGVKEYLLKPIDEEELAECVRRIREELIQREDERLYHSANENIVREELLRRILLQMETREKLAEKIERHQLSFGEEILCAAILTERKQLSCMEGSVFQDKVKMLLQEEELYDEKVTMDNQVVLIRFGMDYKTWAGLLARRNEKVQRRFGDRLLIAVGHNVNQWYDLCYSYELARFMLEQNFLFGQYDVLSISAIDEQQKNAECPSAEQIMMLIEVGDLEGIKASVEKFEIYCRKLLMKEVDIKIRIMYNLMTIRNCIEKNMAACRAQSWISWNR